MKRIFISYASKDKWVREWLAPKLEEYGIDVQADYKTFLFGKTSLENIEMAIENSHHTFFVITENWLASEWTELESLILQTESPANRDLKYFVLKREECRIPKRLKPFTYVDLTDDALVETQIKRLLEQIGTVSNSKFESKPQHISLSRLPDTSGLLFGREEELKLLDNAWEDPHIHVVSFVAQGGEGKTALTRRWVNNMEKDGFRGAERVYAWSFYSQGTSEDRQVSGDLFLAETLTWFGDAAMANSPASARQKAQQLAILVRQQKTLLILDGVEPLQYPPGEPQNGRMRDEGVKVLLKELMGSNSGLCVVSTRQEIRELNGGLVLQQPLSPLSESAGADLLAELLKVKNRRKELEEAAKEYHGHALALTLLGNLLREYHHGDIRQRDVIPPLEEEDEWGSHAKRVLVSYANLLEGKPELGILRIMSLFDRPADVAVVNELRKGAAIPAITEALRGLSEMEWKRACKHLRDLGLLEKGDSLDCHPLIREHFALELSRGHEVAWKEAHRRLYEYYKALPEKELPDTLEEMEPLYLAMGHGCKAGLYQEVFCDIYYDKIIRGNEYYSISFLGGISLDLAAIVGFFTRPWSNLQQTMAEIDRAFLMNMAGRYLRDLGRLADAVEPTEGSFRSYVNEENSTGAALSASNLSHLLLYIGDIAKAVKIGTEAVKYANDNGDHFRHRVNLTVLADALHHSGKSAEAEELFINCEQIQFQEEVDHPKLYGMTGYRFCDLLLGLGKWEEVKERATYSLKISTDYTWHRDMALAHLCLGMALYQQKISGGKCDFVVAASHFEKAIDCFELARTVYLIPLALLARAALLRDMEDYSSAQADLDEVLEIAYPEMRLHLTDYHLESARLCLAMGGKLPEAQDHYEKAKTLIAETGYHRRDKELDALKSQLKQ